ncbi:MAG: helix-turn-helix transcriptional regulator, partial [Actinomycetota bacterium]|nr:helix-turn-helix transcriptional regulator [Actinomycetota bacterium]
DADLLHELAVARLELARLLAQERPEVAGAQARAALAGFQHMGVARDADAAAGLLRQLGERGGRSWPRNVGPLTERQAQVLALLAEGLTNAEIAERLYISPRTAEHHVSNILSDSATGPKRLPTPFATRSRPIPQTRSRYQRVHRGAQPGPR